MGQAFAAVRKGSQGGWKAAGDRRVQVETDSKRELGQGSESGEA